MSTQQYTAAPLLWLDEHEVCGPDLLDVMRRNGQLTSSLQELVLDRHLKSVEISQEEEHQFLAEFRQQQGLTEEEAYLGFLQQRLLDERLLLQTLCRPHRVVKYREERWGPRANSLYLQRKERYDAIRYYRLEAGNADVMQEVYFRLKDREETWQGLAAQINPDDPTATGLIGPVAVSNVEPELLQQLREAGEGKLLRPVQIGTTTIVAQLVEILPSEFNEELRAQLLREAFDEWLAEECARMIQKVRFAA